MTSKEFLRRANFYRSLDIACFLFCESDRKFIYRVVLLTDFNRKVQQFVTYPSFACFGESFINDCISLYFDRFTREDFMVQFRYFKSFYNRCSQYQKESLCNNSSLSNLLFMLDNEA